MPHVHYSHTTDPFNVHTATLPVLAHPLPILQPLPFLDNSSGSAASNGITNGTATHSNPTTTTTNNGPPYSLPTHTTILIAGAGPAGIFTTNLLLRYGIPASHILTLDSSTTRTVGHADGLFARTLEVFDSLGILAEIERDAGDVREQTQWAYQPPKTKSNAVNDSSDEAIEEGGSKDDKLWSAPGAQGEKKASPGPLTHVVDEKGGIKRDFLRPFVTLTSRYKSAFRSLAQGKVERILEDDALRYAGGQSVVRRGLKVANVEIEEGGDKEFPVVVDVEAVSTRKVSKVRCKYVIGADGAHSMVRRSLDVKMEGATSDDLWGVVDFVAETDFPDIYRVAQLIHPNSVLLHVPREKDEEGRRLSRMYVLFDQVAGGVGENGMKEGLKADVEDGDRTNVEEAKKSLRKEITLEKIMVRIKEMFAPYSMDIMEGSAVQWWAVYQVGQRVAEKMIVRDTKGWPRVFIMGDAAHTHSPKLGQGMNVSMMDGYDLAWKLAHTVLGLTPSPRELLETFEIDRRNNGLNLIDMDRRWYAVRYGRNQDNLRGTADWIPPKWEEIGLEMAAFITGTAVEYEEGTITVDDRKNKGTTDRPGALDSYALGALREGRRLGDDAKLTRFVDGVPVDLQRQCVSDGIYRILAFATTSFLENGGSDQATLQEICSIANTFPDNVVKVIIVHPLEHRSFEWADLPVVLRKRVHSYLFGGDEAVYKKYGVDMEKGALAVVRPDQYVGSIAEFLVGGDGTDKITKYLERLVAVRK